MEFLLGVVRGSFAKGKVLDKITEEFIDEYNASCKEETERLRQPDADIQLSLTIKELLLQVLMGKIEHILTVKAKRSKFSYQNDVSIRAHTLELQSLAVNAVQYKNLSILSLSQISLLSSVNKLLGKKTVAVQNANASVVVYLQMCLKMAEEVCGYVGWHEMHGRSARKSCRVIEKLYLESKEERGVEFAFLEVLVADLRVKVMFQESLLYVFKLENIANISNPTIKSPYVIHI